jgi:hypothetical protein
LYYHKVLFLCFQDGQHEEFYLVETVVRRRAQAVLGRDMGRGGAAVRVFYFLNLLSHEMDFAFEDIHDQF